MIRKDQLYVVGFMMLTALVFGAAVSGLYIGSRSTLETNRRLRLQKAYVTVFDLGDPARMTPPAIDRLVDRQIDLSETVQDPETGERFTLIKAYADAERAALKAYGFRFRGSGFWAPIEGLLAVDPRAVTTLGIVVLEQQETPGLGGRITEPVFTEQFKAGVKVAAPGVNGKYVEISATAPEQSSPMYERHVDAITGATQTCMAMERILNEHVAQFQRAMEARGEY